MEMLSRLGASQYCTCTCARLIETPWTDRQRSRRQLDSSCTEKVADWMMGIPQHNASFRRTERCFDERNASHVKCRGPIMIKAMCTFSASGKQHAFNISASHWTQQAAKNNSEMNTVRVLFLTIKNLIKYSEYICTSARMRCHTNPPLQGSIRQPGGLLLNTFWRFTTMRHFFFLFFWRLLHRWHFSSAADQFGLKMCVWHLSWHSEVSR